MIVITNGNMKSGSIHMKIHVRKFGADVKPWSGSCTWGGKRKFVVARVEMLNECEGMELKIDDGKVDGADDKEKHRKNGKGKD